MPALKASARKERRLKNRGREDPGCKNRSPSALARGEVWRAENLKDFLPAAPAYRNGWGQR